MTEQLNITGVGPIAYKPGDSFKLDLTILPIMPSDFAKGLPEILGKDLTSMQQQAIHEQAIVLLHKVSELLIGIHTSIRPEVAAVLLERAFKSTQNPVYSMLRDQLPDGRWWKERGESKDASL